MKSRSKLISIPRILALFTCAVLVGSNGCHRAEQDPGKVFARITAGMTAADVEAALGPGTDVGYDKLPQIYRIVLDTPPQGTAAAKGDGVVYRTWTRTAGDNKAVSHIAFRDGKVVNGTVYVETLCVGK